MKVEQHHQRYNWRPLNRADRPGTTVKFEHKFHMDNCLDDIFLVIDICGAYRDRSSSTEGKIAIVNLRSNKLSFVSAIRRVRIVQATVHVDEL